MRPTFWGPTVSGYQIWIPERTHWTGSLKSGCLQSWATDFGARDALPGLRAYSLGAYSLGTYSLSGYRFRIPQTTHWTGGLQSGGLQSEGLQSGSLQSGRLHSGGLQSGGLQSGAYSLGTYNPSGYRFWVSGTKHLFTKKKYRGPLNVNIV